MDRAGFFSCDITPSRAAYLGGYAGRTAPSEGVADPLFLRVAALEDGRGQRLVIATFDLIGIPRAISARVYRWAEHELGLPEARLILNAAHTHCGPILEDRYCHPDWKVDHEYVEKFVSALQCGIAGALSALRRITVKFGVAEIDFGVNRRRPEADGIAMRPYPEGYYNNEVPLFAFYGDGQLLGLLYSMNCHPTSRGGQLISADYPGAVARHLDIPYPCFIQGAAGSAKPRFTTPDGTAFRAASSDELDQAGQRVAAAIRACLDSEIMREMPLELPATTESVELPLDLSRGLTREQLIAKRDNPASLKFEKIAAAVFLDQMDHGTLPSSCRLRIGCFGLIPGVRIITVSGEITAEAARMMVRNCHDYRIFVWGYTGFTAAYLPTSDMLPERGYEAFDSQQYYGMSAPFSPEIDSRLQQAVRECLERIRTAAT